MEEGMERKQVEAMLAAAVPGANLARLCRDWLLKDDVVQAARTLWAENRNTYNARNFAAALARHDEGKE
jgi:hypothetical protein